MTNAELQELLKQYPDDADVSFWMYYGPPFDEVVVRYEKDINEINVDIYGDCD